MVELSSGHFPSLLLSGLRSVSMSGPTRREGGSLAGPTGRGTTTIE
jgi:hypothetical protein